MINLTARKLLPSPSSASDVRPNGWLGSTMNRFGVSHANHGHYGLAGIFFRLGRDYSAAATCADKLVAAGRQGAAIRGYLCTAKKTTDLSIAADCLVNAAGLFGINVTDLRHAATSSLTPSTRLEQVAIRATAVATKATKLPKSAKQLRLAIAACSKLDEAGLVNVARETTGTATARFAAELAADSAHPPPPFQDAPEHLLRLVRSDVHEVAFEAYSLLIRHCSLTYEVVAAFSTARFSQITDAGHTFRDNPTFGMF